MVEVDETKCATPSREEGPAESDAESFELEDDLEADLERMIDMEEDDAPAEDDEQETKETKKDTLAAELSDDDGLRSDEDLFGDADQDAPSPNAKAPATEATPAPTAGAAESVNAKGDKGDMPSNMMEGPNGQRMLKWKTDYAGGHQAQCRDPQCLERLEAGGSRVIKKGMLRIGRRVLNDKGFGADGDAQMMMMWYHGRCIFNSFLRARKTTRTIQGEHDIEGFGNLHDDDKNLVRRMIEGNEDLRKATARGTEGVSTPAPKGPRGGADGIMHGPGGGPARQPGSGQKRSYHDMIFGTGPQLELNDRVWAFFRDGVDRVKSKKSELGMIRTAAPRMDGCIRIQFESNDDRKDREEKYLNPRRKRTRGWNRYARVFNGPSQWIPRHWLDVKRAVPPLCGCIKNTPDHMCAAGVACKGKQFNHIVYGPEINAIDTSVRLPDELKKKRGISTPSLATRELIARGGHREAYRGVGQAAGDAKGADSD